jgi:hypothetical protein
MSQYAFQRNIVINRQRRLSLLVGLLSSKVACQMAEAYNHDRKYPLSEGHIRSHRELGDQWGYFSLREMKRLVAKIKSDQV